jgi:hypothetical protein
MNIRVIYSDDYLAEDITKIEKLLEDNFDNKINYDKIDVDGTLAAD